MSVAEIIDRWAGQPSGFVWVDGRGWIPVQETALKYAEDERRNTGTHAEWEASAGRFVGVVESSDRWCLDPEEATMLDDAKVIKWPWALDWQGTKGRKSA